MVLIMYTEESKQKTSKPCTLWKFDQDGNERPLEEQLLRRQGDLDVILRAISFYNRSPLHRDPLKRAAAEKHRTDHLQNIQSDISKIERQLKSKNHEN